jgi:hypothetical protein
MLEPAPSSAVLGRLDTGGPWLVERNQGRGRVLALATPIDAEAGTLPVNPDFVPLAHELIFYLAGAGDPLLVRAGEPLYFPLERAPEPELQTLRVETPSGRKAEAEVIRSGGLTRARFDDTTESGIYRVLLAAPSGGVMYGAVARDERESDLTPLDAAEAAKLVEGWPLQFVSESNAAAHPVLAGDSGSRHEIWRFLVFAALGLLCLEIYLTRRLVRAQTVAG